jgi:phosphatidylserine decarboxylase
MSLLFKESPILGVVAVASVVASYVLKITWLIVLCIVVMMFLLYFYRYDECLIRVSDDTLISPCEGEVIKINQSNKTYIAIFMSPFNKHTQIYPVNGVVEDVIYDNTGKFDLVMNLDKSIWNEKKMHKIIANIGAIVNVYQIAGFLPRVITSNDKPGDRVRAGEYLGMIKFGSRIDLLIEGDVQLNVKEGDKVSIGDTLGKFTPRLVGPPLGPPARRVSA